MNKWLYAGANPITRKDATEKWFCTGHPDCTDWINIAIAKLETSGDTGKLLVQFLNDYDARIKKGQDAKIQWALEMGAEKYDPCFKGRHKAGGLHIEFTNFPFPSSLANTFDEHKLQFLISENITGPNPTNWGVITFGYEISHYKQGAERLTIQGEMCAQYAGAQIWKDLGEVATDMPHSFNMELVSTTLGYPEEYNPITSITFYNDFLRTFTINNEGLVRAQKKMAEGSWSYNLLPLYFNGLRESWFTDLNFDWYTSIKYK